MLENIRQILETKFHFRPNKNQLKDIERLIFEIMRRENVSLDEIVNYLDQSAQLHKYTGGNIFYGIKNSLVKKRFPLTSSREIIDTEKIFLNPIQSPLTDNYQVKNDFKPLHIFIEKEVASSKFASQIKGKFPKIPISELDYQSEYLKKNKFKLSDLKKPIVFIVKEKWDFIKPCPCTKGHLPCGYWIFNLSFGCPYDCSYCFLQQYSNFPGIILPANVEDFFEKFDAFLKKIKKPIRIGTGEFCDSLALDHLTGYSKKLVPYFKDKNLLFELKTKSTQIENILSIEASKNIVISWSLNPKDTSDKEERGAPSLKERLNAAKTVQKKGFRIAFHFDPIIHSENWKALYKNMLEQLYNSVSAPFSWISLGTLRSHRNLKSAVEKRLPESNIFYGELFIGKDKKLRYPEFLRREIYENMVKWIREHDTKTPVYLCMENKKMWEALGDRFKSSKDIESYILKQI
ncbi:MAG: radical SAM protein [Candidatus Omnitrophota bacterium]